MKLKKKYEYFWSKAAIEITFILFFTQFISEVTGMISRKPEHFWVMPVCGALFGISVLWGLCLIILNSRET